MKKVLITMGVIVMFLTGTAQKKWQKEGIKRSGPVCYASKTSHKSYIAPPEEYLKRLKSGQAKQSQIIVDYVGFTDTPKAAFEYAVDIWEYLLRSPVPIHMTARWTSLDTDVLGNCSPYEYYGNFEGAPLKDHYYPVALAEKLTGTEINGETTPDMIAQFNKDNKDWYFGTDGNTPANKYDFVSIVMHEIAHGLGFTGSFSENSGLGTYGSAESFPDVFDEFVINRNQQQLIDTTLFANPSAELLQQLTSGFLYSKSDVAKQSSSDGKYPRLYAPDPFDNGSSIYHLNEYTYMPGDTNSLMTPFAGAGEAIHHPGPHVLGIFADMGWIYTSIIHQEIGDIETVTEPIPVFATISTDTGIDSSSVTLVYTTAEFDTADSISLQYDPVNGRFSATFPNLENGKVKYYLAVTDTAQRVFRLPTEVPNDYFDFIIGPDTIPPVITHDPVKYMLELVQTADIDVTATDNIGIATVVVEYKINNQDAIELPLTETDSVTFSGQFNFDGLVDGDSVSYRIIATDSSSNSMTASLPEVGYFTFYVNGIYDPVTSYSNDFNTKDLDFISSDFYTATEAFFDNGTLNSPHPYPSPDQDDTNYEFTALLKYPIILSNYIKMTFNEVVLVEPGETGTVFGDDEFWDYAVVEGSKKGQDNWLPLVDGYDSRANSTWLLTYNSYISGNNSIAVGKKSFFNLRNINLLENGNFATGDTILIRFRLFSDPYAHGWGWAIDNLTIQSPPTDAGYAEISPASVAIYPNPVKDKLLIKGSFDKYVGEITISLRNSTGTLEYQKLINPKINQFEEIIDTSPLSPGLYLVTIQYENGQISTEKIIKQ